VSHSEKNTMISGCDFMGKICLNAGGAQAKI